MVSFKTIKTMKIIGKSDDTVNGAPMRLVCRLGNGSLKNLFLSIKYVHLCKYIVSYEDDNGVVRFSVKDNLIEALERIKTMISNHEMLNVSHLLTLTPAVYRGALRTIQSTEDGKIVVYYDNEGYYLTSALGTTYEGEGSTIEEALYNFTEVCKELFEEDDKCFNQ